MSRTSSHDASRVEELLAGRELRDLSLAEERELAAMPDEGLERAGGDSLALAAAEVYVNGIRHETLEALPLSLQRRILHDAPRYVNGSPSIDEAKVKRVADIKPDSKSGRRREILAWACVAASLLVACGIWWSGRTQPLSALAAREALIQTCDDCVLVSWSTGKTPFPSDVSGDVVWSNSRQQGFMRFVGMPTNDPAREQYQLWIVDPSRDANPIDGGVFDVASSGEVVVPIDAKLRVVSPAAFAVTIEKPGGVVVSSQERLPLIAAVPNSNTASEATE